MSENGNDKFRQLIAYFFCEMAAPLSVIKGYSQILEMYLAGLKEYEISPVALNFSSVWNGNHSPIRENRGFVGAGYILPTLNSLQIIRARCIAPLQGRLSHG